MGGTDDTIVELTYGADLQRFETSTRLQPANCTMVAYDYQNGEIRSGQPKNIALRSGLNDIGKHTLETSTKFYNTQPKHRANYEISRQGELDDIIDMQAALQSSSLVRFSGRSTHPGVQVGSCINVQGSTSWNSPVETIGSYRIVAVHHYCDDQQDYVNDFEAIPISVNMPPVNIPPEPPCETQSAFVTDNYDEAGLGRVRVRFHWMNVDEKTPWIRITSSYGGVGKGMHFIPEIGEEVLVGFEGGRAVRPYVIGTVYNGKEKTAFGNAGNDVKALQSKSGNKLIMNDKDGSLHISDAKGNDIMLDGKGSIKVASKKSITLTCGDSKIEMTENGTINISGKCITVSATESAQIKSAKTTVSGSEEASLKGGNLTTITASGNVTVKGALIKLN